MKKLAYLLMLSAGAALGQNVYNTGHAVVGGPSSGAGVTGGSCPTGQVVSALSSSGVPTCVVAGTGGGVADPGANGLMKRTGTNVTAPATQADVLGVLGTATDATTGAMSNSDHTALPGMSPVGHETNGTSYDGAKNIYSSSTLCPATGCVVQVPSSYHFDAVRGLGQFGWGNGFQFSGEGMIDPHGGQTRLYHNNPLLGALYQNSVGLDNETTWQIGGDNVDHVGLNNIVSDSSPGINNAYFGQTVAAQGWSGRYGIYQTLAFQGQGIHGAVDIHAQASAAGDFHIYLYLMGHGGFRAFGDEGQQTIAAHGDEATTQYRGTINSVSGDHVQTTAVAGYSYGDIGIQQRAVDVTPASQIWSGFVTAAAASTDTNGANYETLTLGGGSTVTPSKYGCTLDADIDVPTIVPTATSTVYQTSTTFGCTIIAGVGSGVPAVGDHITLHNPFVEPVVLTAVTSPSSGHYQMTAMMSRNHFHGQKFYEWSNGLVGFAFNDNTTFPSPGDPLGIPYYYDTIGATANNQVVAVLSEAAIEQPMGLNNGFGNVDLSSMYVGDSYNTGGVLTLNIYLPADPQLLSYPTLTIRGASDSRFNGQCTNARNYREIYGGGAALVDCDQAASTGLHLPYSDPVVVTFGDTGYGNTRATMAPMAEIIDINTYPAQPGCLPANGGAGCVPAVLGLMRLSPNAMPMPTNGTILVSHDVSMLIDGMDLYQNVSNPMTYGNLLNIVTGGSGVNSNRTGFIMQNANAPSMSAGFGGKSSIPPGIRIEGIWNYLLSSDYAPPWKQSGLTIGCPAVFGCANANYYYDFFRLSTASGLAAMRLYPGLNLAIFRAGVTYGFGQLQNQGIEETAMGGAVASATTIAVPAQIFHVTGTTPIATITAPSACTNIQTVAGATTNFACQITIIPDGAFPITSAGNVAVASTATLNQPIILTYDPGTSKWYPSGASSGSLSNPALNGGISLQQSNTGSDAGVPAPTAGVDSLFYTGGATKLSHGTNAYSQLCTADGVGCPTGIANVQVVLPTTALAANTCTAAATVTMPGLLATSTFSTAFATNPMAVTGWGANGGVTFVAWPTTNTLNWSVCDQTGAAITAGAMTLNVGAR